MGKKSKANKLAKMSEDERARYLQLRADIEEEARRRKIQLISMFMKNKLKCEDAFCRLNMAKINQEWRSILRQIKCDELRKEISALETYSKQCLARKDRTISRLLNAMEEEDNIYATLQQSNMEIMRKMLTTHSQRSDFFAQAYESQKNELLQESEEDIKYFQELRDQSHEQLECVAYQLEQRREEQLKEGEEKHLDRVDDLKSTMQLELEQITKSREANLELLWQQFQDVLNGYMQRTEGFHAEYMDLKERDDESTTIMRDNCREIEHLTEQLGQLKMVDADATEKNESKVGQLKAVRDELADKLSVRKREVEQEIREQEQKIKMASVESYKAKKHLEKYVTMGERMLQLSMVCRKYETEREKVMAFGFPPIQMFEHTEEEMSQPPQEMKELNLGTWKQMENFWKKVNNVTIDVMCLKQEKINLQGQNERLKKELQEHLANMNLASGSNIHINDYLSKRPQSMRVDRVKPMDLAQKPKCQSARGSLRSWVKPCVRPMTTPYTEAIFTNAVRSKRLAQGKPMLPKITRIVNW